CFTTTITAAGAHYYTTWADPWTAVWFAGGTTGGVGAIRPPTAAGVYTAPPKPNATIPTATSTTGYVRTSPTTFVANGYLWGVQGSASPSTCSRTNFSSSHAGTVQALFGDGSVHQIPSGYDLGNLYFVSTPANGDLWPGDF